MALRLEERTYWRVPQESTLEIRATPQAGTAYTLNGRVDRGSTRLKTWRHTQLNNRTVTCRLDETGTTIARVAAAFTGTATSSVRIEAKIEKPDGTQHSTTWTVALGGKNGDVSRAKIRVRVS